VSVCQCQGTQVPDQSVKDTLVDEADTCPQAITTTLGFVVKKLE